MSNNLIPNEKNILFFMVIGLCSSFSSCLLCLCSINFATCIPKKKREHEKKDKIGRNTLGETFIEPSKMEKSVSNFGYLIPLIVTSGQYIYWIFVSTYIMTFYFLQIIYISDIHSDLALVVRRLSFRNCYAYSHGQMLKNMKTKIALHREIDNLKEVPEIIFEMECYHTSQKTITETLKFSKIIDRSDSFNDIDFDLVGITFHKTIAPGDDKTKQYMDQLKSDMIENYKNVDKHYTFSEKINYQNFKQYAFFV
eukprot:gene8210-35_t